MARPRKPSSTPETADNNPPPAPNEEQPAAGPPGSGGDASPPIAGSGQSPPPKRSRKRHSEEQFLNSDTDPSRPPEPADTDPPATAPETRDDQSPEQPPRGLDDEQHAAEQRAAQLAEVLNRDYVTTFMVDPLSAEGIFDPPSIRIYLDHLLEDSGNPRDGCQKILIEHMGMMKLLTARLLCQAAAAKSNESIKILNGLCIRYLGEMRRTAVALDAMKDKSPAIQKLRIAKVA